MKNTLLIFCAVATLLITSCDQTSRSGRLSEGENNGNESVNSESDPVINNTGIPGLAGDEVMTAERQASISPNYVLQRLKDGNNRFINGSLTKRDHTVQIRKSIKAQYPKAIILGCVDSRVPVEDVFDLGLGDVFVARVAGNFTNSDILGSMEYACKVAGSKLVMVLGHEHCGAIKSAIDGADMGNITSMLSNLNPALEMSSNFNGQKNSKNPAFVQKVCENNVRLTVEKIREDSTILREMEDSGQIIIVGGVYDMDSGAVMFLEEN